MENNANQLNLLCKRNCGFFGNAAYDGYCSKCYKDHVKRQNTGSAAGRVTPTGINSSSSSSLNSQSQPPNDIIPVTSAVIITPPQNSETTTTSFNINAINNNSESSLSSLMIGVLNNNLSSSTADSSSVSIASSISTATSAESTQAGVATTALGVGIPTATSSSSVPIPIPSNSSSFQSHKLNNAADMDPTAMSVPSDMLLSSSLLSTTSTSPLGASIGDNNLSGSMLASSGAAGALGGMSEKKKRSRCVLESCKRKVGLTGFDCRCGGLYCWEHRYSDKHDCKFDYKELGQDQIRKNNPIVVGEKIQKI